MLSVLPPPSAANNVVAEFAQRIFPPGIPLGMVLYEPIKPNDAFGKVMVENLARRGIELLTVQEYGSMEAQRERLRGYGFLDGVRVWTVDMLWEAVEEEERERVARLEMVDEVEEWKLLAEHYCVAWGWRDGGEDVGEGKGGDCEGEKSRRGVWDRWKDQTENNRESDAGFEDGNRI